MEKDKLCPMSFNSPEQIDILSCKEEKCAWWNDKYKICAIRLIAIMSTREIRDA